MTYRKQDGTFYTLLIKNSQRPITSSMATQKKSRAVPLEIVVRRGAIRRFHKLSQKTESLPVAVTWDRRLGDRRTAAVTASEDRRGPDRRQKPPFTWDVSDFVIVAKPEKRAARGTRKPQAS
jgi:hypothetical protein